LTICSLLEQIAKCKEENLEELINHSYEEGNNRNADLLVEDIYGGSFHGLGINGSIIASSLSKVSLQQ
jgi:pantothenate kinase